MAGAEHYSETARCTLCGAIGYKSRMIDETAFGWFCNDDEAEEFWFHTGRPYLAWPKHEIS
jgi:hypothetical protein